MLHLPSPRLPHEIPDRSPMKSKSSSPCLPHEIYALSSTKLKPLPHEIPPPFVFPKQRMSEDPHKADESLPVPCIPQIFQAMKSSSSPPLETGWPCSSDFALVSINLSRIMDSQTEWWEESMFGRSSTRSTLFSWEKLFWGKLTDLYITKLTDEGVVVREYDEERYKVAVEELERQCEVEQQGKPSLVTNLMGDPLCRARSLPLHIMLVVEYGGEENIVGVIRGSVTYVIRESVLFMEFTCA